MQASRREYAVNLFQAQGFWETTNCFAPVGPEHRHYFIFSCRRLRGISSGADGQDAQDPDTRVEVNDLSTGGASKPMRTARIVEAHGATTVLESATSYALDEFGRDPNRCRFNSCWRGVERSLAALLDVRDVERLLVSVLVIWHTGSSSRANVIIIHPSV